MNLLVRMIVKTVMKQTNTIQKRILTDNINKKLCQTKLNLKKQTK